MGEPGARRPGPTRTSSSATATPTPGTPPRGRRGLANLDVIERDGLLDRALAVGDRLSDGLRSLQADGLVTEVRGEGAVWAVELPEGKDAPAVRDALLGEGVIVRPLGTALAMCPPLVITDEQVDRIVDGMAAVLGA